MLKERRTQTAATLSGGEQQMLTIARALMMKPDLLILDEPTLGLAPVIMEQISKALERLRQATEMTVLLGEQNVTFALPHADRVYVLEHGRIAWEGDPSRFAAKRERGIFSAAWRPERRHSASVKAISSPRPRDLVDEDDGDAARDDEGDPDKGERVRQGAEDEHARQHGPRREAIVERRDSGCAAEPIGEQKPDVPEGDEEARQAEKGEMLAGWRAPALEAERHRGRGAITMTFVVNVTTITGICAGTAAPDQIARRAQHRGRESQQDRGRNPRWLRAARPGKPRQNPLAQARRAPSRPARREGGRRPG